MHPDPVEIAAAWDRTADMLAGQFPKVKDLMDTAKTDVLAFAAFPVDHWRKIWSNNPVRHEAPHDRVEVKGLHCWAVAAA